MNVDHLFGFDLYRICFPPTETSVLIHTAEDNLIYTLEELEKRVKDFCSLNKWDWYREYRKNYKYTEYIENCIKQHIDTYDLVNALNWDYTKINYERIKQELLNVGIKYVADYFCDQMTIEWEHRRGLREFVIAPFSWLI